MKIFGKTISKFARSHEALLNNDVIKLVDYSDLMRRLNKGSLRLVNSRITAIKELRIVRKCT